jgi:hypothetical protein
VQSHPDWRYFFGSRKLILTYSSSKIDQFNQSAIQPITNFPPKKRKKKWKVVLNSSKLVSTCWASFRKKLILWWILTGWISGLNMLFHLILNFDVHMTCKNWNRFQCCFNVRFHFFFFLWVLTNYSEWLGSICLKKADLFLAWIFFREWLMFFIGFFGEIGCLGVFN